jgi:DnaJ-class molecular chaperone
VGARIFLVDDALAHAHGWQVTAGRSGLSRSYRDPRFDLLARCPDCSGYGVTDGKSCHRCAATGRIRLDADRCRVTVQGVPR